MAELIMPADAARIGSTSFRGIPSRRSTSRPKRAQHHAMTISVTPSGQACGARVTGGYDGHDRLLHRTTIAAWNG